MSKPKHYDVSYSLSTIRNVHPCSVTSRLETTLHSSIRSNSISSTVVYLCNIVSYYDTNNYLPHRIANKRIRPMHLAGRIIILYLLKYVVELIILPYTSTMSTNLNLNQYLYLYRLSNVE